MAGLKGGEEKERSLLFQVFFLLISSDRIARGCRVLINYSSKARYLSVVQLKVSLSFFIIAKIVLRDDAIYVSLYLMHS